MTAVRDAYRATLKELGEQDLRIAGLETDAAPPIKSGIFENAFPERHFNVGTSELNMVPMTAGLARIGFIPFINTFAVSLITRETGPTQSLTAYDKLNIKLCGVYYGLSDSYGGVSRQAITDMALARPVLSMTVISTADELETGKAVSAIAEYQGPVYLRLSRASAPVFYGDDMRSEIGGDVRVKEEPDVVIITTGALLHNVIQAAAVPEVEGVRAAVVDMHIVEPIDQSLVPERAEQTRAIVIVEEHSVYGGLGSTVAKVLAERCPVPMERARAVGFAESGDYGQLTEKYEYGPESVVLGCRAVMGRRQDNEMRTGRIRE